MDKLKEKEDKAVGLFYNKIENDKNNKQGNIIKMSSKYRRRSNSLQRHGNSQKTLGLKTFLLLGI